MTDRESTAARAGEPELLESLKDGILRLTLNRPKARNALSSSLMSSLQSAIDRAADTEEIRVVLIAGNGPAFCAGHDLKELRANVDVGFYDRLFRQVSRLMTSMIHLPKPVIARVHGIATAAGCQLVASCDLAYAETGTRFATPGVNIGLFCSTPMVAVSRKARY